MSEFKISRLRFTWVGEWQDQIFYNTDEIVQYEGKAYLCLIPHTSNGFYADLGAVEPKWDLVMPGQTWKGDWTPSTLYSLDNIVIFGGIVYKCNTQHVSRTVLDLDIEKWDIYAESKTWAEEWTSSTTYGIGAIVQYGASVYECTVSHVSAESDLEGLEADYNPGDSTLTKWKLLKNGVAWKGEYATRTDESSQLRYKLNDLVRYGPSIYKCVVGHAPVVEYPNYNENVPLTSTFISAYWEEWLPGLDFEEMWDPTVVYQPGDVVLYGGYLYANKVINNVNIKPSFNYLDSTDAWELVNKAYDVEGVWNSSTTYKVGSVVNYGGDLYVALVDNTNQKPGATEITVTYTSAGSSGTTLKVSSTTGIRTGMNLIGQGFSRGQTVTTVVDSTTVTLNEAPDRTMTNGASITFAGVNATNWELLIPGFEWKGQWQSGVTYYQDDVIYWKNATYKSIREHTSSLVTRPDNDLTNAHWVIYLQHNRTNTLSTTGEIVIYQNGTNTPLAIGAETNVLKIIEGLPSWSEIDFTPSVYFVATNGIDAPDRGTTFDTAWRSIKYACEKVKEGIRYPNARILLENNKDFIIQETFNWFIYQQNNLIEPFDQSINFDNEKTIRDSQYILDGLIGDLSRGGNSRTVSNTLSFFDLESTNKFTNDQVAEQIEYFIAVQIYLFDLVNYVLNNTVPPQNYQTLNGVQNPVTQFRDNSLVVNPAALTFLGALENILLSALVAGSPRDVPPANESGYATINVKSGTYDEELPIVIPSNTALNGDELRGAVVRPARPVNTLCTRTIGQINQFVVGSTANMENNTPVQFVSLNPVVETSTIIGGITAGQTYYVIGSSITDTTFQVSETPNGPPVPLLTNIGFMYVYGGQALSDMFYVQNATGIRNMTCTGLLGTLTQENQFLTRRPTGGAYVSLDPGEGPDDTSAWITYKSPYIQNVTNFGVGCVGLKIDSTLHEGGNHSIVCNDFTQILSDGIGIWCTGGDALCEAVSVFSYYGYAGYFSENGGRIRATNGNSSYGTFGCVAEGFDLEEIPATGVVNNKSRQASASAVSALGSNAEILKIQYTHAGEEYFESTTNMLLESNNFLDNTTWLNDGNITVTRAASTPFAGQPAWRISGDTGLSDSSYFYQSIPVSPQGKTYTNISGSNITGSGVGATFDITVESDRYVVAVNSGGSGYVVGNQIRISGQEFGAPPEVNDIIVTVSTLSITSILTITFTGIVPEGSALPYTSSIYAKKGTAQYFDMYAIFSGFDTKTSYIRFNFDTEEITTQSLENLGIVPTSFNAEFVEDGWWRISFTTWDVTAQNTALEYRVYPRGIDGISGFTNFYGAQLQIGDTATFYLNNTDSMPTAYANIDIQGAGSGVKAIADELRSGAIYQTRVLESADVRVGGLGYKTQSNNAQTGTTEFLTLAQSEVATAAEYEGMRLSISTGRGAGQYGIISRYDPISKNAFVLKESFENLEIVSTNSTTDRFELAPDADFNTMYLGQKLQFTPTFYDTTVTKTSQNSVTVSATEGDLNNLMTVDSTVRLRVNMPITFTGTVFGGVVTNFTYYIIDIVDATTIQISTSQGGGVWPLNTETGSMTLNYPSNTSFLFAESTSDMQIAYPIQFTGNSIGGVNLGDTYYIQEIYDLNNFTISDSLVNLTVTGTTVANNGITVDDTTPLTPLTPIIFKGNAGFGNLQVKTKYYVNSLIDGTTFNISSSVIDRTATATQAITNLITVNSTAGFVVNRPIVFVGTTFGNIVKDKVYYIQVVNDATTFTISESPGGAAVSLTTAVGNVFTRTTANVVTQTNSAGSLIAVSTGDKEELTAGTGNMGASFYTETFGNISQGTTYYVLEKFEGATNEFTITATAGGTTPVQILSDTGSMQIGEVGWDHINPGTPIVTQFDSTSTYLIEPRLVYSRPQFYRETMSQPVDLSVATSYNIIASSGFKAIAVPKIGNRVLTSTAFEYWDQFFDLPKFAQEEGNGGWVDATYGNKTWIIISKTGEDALYSVSDGITWLNSSLPTLTGGATYSAITYGNGRFIALAKDSNKTAYSLNNGGSWTEVTDSVLASDWVDIAYGNDTFVAICSSTELAKYSTDGGLTWNATELVSGDSTVYNWTQIKFGNGRFVAVSSDKRSSVYSFDGITWYESELHVNGTKLEYGQGVFLLLNSEDPAAYTSEDGINWKKNEVGIPLEQTAIGFSFAPNTKKGWFLSLADDGTGFRYNAGAKAQGRATIDSGSILNISMWEPGSGYQDATVDSTSTAELTIVDPNNSQDALTQLRIGNGSLGAPTFVSFGTGYNTNSTSIAINGDGYANLFQTGLRLIAKNVSRLPSPGDNLEFEGGGLIYRVATARILKGTEVPNLEVEIQLSPQITQELSPADGTNFTLRSRFSQVRLTNHDFLNIGYGNKEQSNYPGVPVNTNLEQQDEIVETNNGRVFYSSTDQDGNFRVGDLFAVEQATGIVTLNASEFGLEGLTELTIGGVALGGSPVIITEFSTDGTFVANSNNIVPTQRAIRTYLASRLSQGGSNTFTGLLTAGTVKVGGPDEITSTVPEGGEGWQIKIGTKANIAGPTAAWAGDGLAMQYFMKSFIDPTRQSSD